MIRVASVRSHRQASDFLTQGLSRLRQGEHQRRPPHQKFLVGRRGSGAWCQGQHPDLAQSITETAGRLALGAAFQTSADLPNSADELFRESAEKVDNKIVMDRRIYGGAPCVANTRVPVYAILEMVEAGYSHKRILKAFPMIDKEGLAAALRFSVLVMER